MKKYRKRPRLKNFDYKGYHRYFVTICTHERNPIFKNDVMVRQLIKVLKDTSKTFGFKVWAYCFMPDHLHLLIEGESPDSDLKRFISSYKQYTGYYYKNHVAQGFSPAQTPAQRKNSKLWQPSYYDHVLRKDEDILNVTRYIVNNPVRKAFVKHFLEYKFTGSFELDIERLL
jgi:putative transposase